MPDVREAHIFKMSHRHGSFGTTEGCAFHRGTQLIEHDLRSASGSQGFSLVEMVAALAIVAVLITAIASAAMMVRQAIPRPNDPLLAAMDASDALDAAAADVLSALYVLDRSATGLTLVVPDRTGDGEPDSIRYAWSGTPGDPLTRSLNGGEATPVVAQVQSFGIAYGTRVEAVTFKGPLVETPVQLVAGYDWFDGLAEEHIHDNKWWGQTFDPQLAATAAGWRIHGVAVQLKRDHNDPTQTRVRIEGVNGEGYPDGVVSNEASVPQLDLTDSFAWTTVNFAGPPLLSPTRAAALTLSTLGNNSARVRLRDWSANVPGGAWVRGQPGWNYKWGPRAMLFKIFATELFDGPPQTHTLTRVTSVTLSLQAGPNNDGPTLHRDIATLNQPDDLYNAWRTGFNADPTTLDANGDGEADWSLSTPWPSTGGGLWSPGSGTLSMQPVPMLYYPTRLDARFRDTGAGGDAATIDASLRLYPGNPQARLQLTLQLETDGTQTLTLLDHTAATTPRQLARRTGLSDGFHHVQALILPQLGSVRLTLDGEPVGAFAYANFPASSPPGVVLHGDAAEFDHIAIESGGTGSEMLNTPPDAVAASSRTSIYQGGTVQFYADASADPDGQPLSYRWDFGDGQVSTSPNPSHYYDDDFPQGWFTATLTVTDPHGQSDSDAISLYHDG